MKRALALLIVFVVCPQAAAVELIAASVFSNDVYHVGATGHLTPLTTGLQRESRPGGVAVDRDGSVYITASGHGSLAVDASGRHDQVRRLHPDGTWDVLYEFDSLYDNPSALAVGADGDVYVVGYLDGRLFFEANWLYRISKDGAATPFATVGYHSNLGIAIDREGIIFAKNEDTLKRVGEVWRVTPDGSSSLFASFPGRACGIAVHGDNLLVADIENHRLVSVDPLGVVSDFASIQNPGSLAVDQGGNVYVGGPESIIKIAPDGSQSIFASGFNDVRGLAIYSQPAQTVPECGTIVLAAIAGLIALSRRRQVN